MEINDAGNYIINAARYLDILEQKLPIIKKEQESFGKNAVKPSANDRTSTNPKNTTLAQKKSINSNITDADFLAQE